MVFVPHVSFLLFAIGVMIVNRSLIIIMLPVVIIWFWPAVPVAWHWYWKRRHERLQDKAYEAALADIKRR